MTDTAPPAEASRYVTRNVKMLMAMHDLTQREVAAHLKLDTASMSRSMRGTRPWQLADLDRLSELFGIEQWRFLQPTNPWPEGNVSPLVSRDVATAGYPQLLRVA